MRIARFSAENFLRLRVVEISPNGDVVTLTGGNGQGKSSVLNAIYAALGGKDHVPAKPIHTGEPKALIKLDLGDIIVTRRFTEKGTDVIVEAQNGSRFPSPQTMLDKLFGHIAFDPLSFGRLEPEEKFEMLRRLVKLDVDVDALRGLNTRDFEARTELNREAKAYTAQAEGIVVRADLPEVRLDARALLDELSAVGTHNAAVQQEISRRGGLRQAIEIGRSTAAEHRREAESLRKRADELDAEAERTLASAMQVQAGLEALPDVPAAKDGAEVRGRLDRAEATNRGIDKREERARLDRLATAMMAEATALTEAMAARNKAIADALATAKYPIEGLAFGEKAVLFGGLPLEQASSAEQIRVSMSIAMALNPDLRVICIREASFLDQNGLKLIAEMAAANKFQVWLEDCRSTDPMAIVLEDGAVKGAPDAPPPADKPAAEPAGKLL